MTACQALSLWTPDVVSGVFEAQAIARVPVAELIQKSGLVATEKLVSMLDYYLSEAASSPVEVVEPVIASAPIARASLAVVEPLREASPSSETPVDSAAVSESSSDIQNFLEAYTEGEHGLLITLTRDWKHDDAAGSNVLVDHFHGLVSAARFAKLGEMENLMKEAENSVRGARDLPAVGDILMQCLRDDVLMNLEKAWKLRATLSQPSQLAGAA